MPLFFIGFIPKVLTYELAVIKEKKVGIQKRIYSRLVEIATKKELKVTAVTGPLEFALKNCVVSTRDETKILLFLAIVILLIWLFCFFF